MKYTADTPILDVDFGKGLTARIHNSVGEWNWPEDDPCGPTPKTLGDLLRVKESGDLNWRPNLGDRSIAAIEAVLAEIAPPKPETEPDPLLAAVIEWRDARKRLEEAERRLMTLAKGYLLQSARD